jgi:hypothetical protein
MKLLGFDLKDKVQRRRFVILAVISNLMCLGLLAHDYCNKNYFDKTRKAALDPASVSAIIIGTGGSWKWQDAELQYGRGQWLRVVDRNDIIGFCNALGSMSPMYVENIRPIQWVEIEVEASDGSRQQMVLKDNFQDEVFIEFNDHMYEATPVQVWLRGIAIKRSH